MKGLKALPTSQQIIRACNAIQANETPLSMQKIALYSQWSRLDPRLGEILVGYLVGHWQTLVFGDLLKSLKLQPWPRSILVLLRFAKLLVKKDQERSLHHFIKSLESSLPPLVPQLFFIPLQRPISVTLFNEVNLRSEPYTKSGFIGSQPLLPHAQVPQEITLLSKRERLRVLHSILKSKHRISVKEYREACHNLVSIRQAQRDLSALARPHGFTKGRRYSLR